MSADLLPPEPTTASAPKVVDFFISYTRSDLAWAQWLAQTLEIQGYTTRYQDRDFAIGTNFVAEMHNGVVDAQAVVAVLSPAYLDSPFCRDEWTAADQATSTQLVPVRVVDFQVEGLLGTRSYIDLAGLNEAEAREALTDRLTALPGVAASSRRTLPADLGRAPHGFPAQLHRVPAGPAPLLGRDDLLNQIEEGLEERQGPVVIVPDVAGVTGRGCTALAADYVRGRGRVYDEVHWIHGRPLALLPLEYRRVGRALGLPPRLRHRDGVNEMLGRRARRGRVLLVVDDAPDRGELVEWLPPPDVECLVTSSSGSYHGEPHVISLGVLSAGEARSALITPARDQPDPAALVLLERLGNDPQSVALLAAYLRAVPGAEPATELLARVDAYVTATNLPAPEALRQVILTRLDEVAPGARGLLALLSFAAPRPVPLACFDSFTRSELPWLDSVVQSPDARQRALVALARLELAHVVWETVAIAGWAGMAARDRLDPEGRTGCRAASIRMFTRALHRAREQGHDELADQIAAHLHAACTDEPSSVPATVALEAHAGLGRHLSDAGLHTEALAVVADGLERAESGELSPDLLVRVLRDAADVHEAAGMRGRAVAALQRARSAAAALDERILVTVLLAMGRLLARGEEPDEATRVFDEADHLIDTADGDLRVQRLELDLARTEAARLLGDVDEALRLADERVETAERYQGPDGIYTVRALIDRGQLRCSRERYRDAATDLEVAIGHLERKAEDDRLADALVEYAAALVHVDQHRGARLALGRAAVIYAARRGRRSDEIHDIRRRLADIAEREGDAERACDLRRLAGLPHDALVVERSDTLKKLDKLRDATITPVLGPGIANRLFTSRQDIARSWAAEGYPMEEYWHRSLAEIAQYRTIRHGDESVRLGLKAHIATDLVERFAPALPYKVRRLDPRDPSTLEDVIKAVGAVERWCDPFEHHAVLAGLPAPIYIIAGASDLLRDALVDEGKEPFVAVCDWRSRSVNKGAPEAAFHYQPTPERPLVLHIFGHLRERGSVVLTESDHIRFAIEFARGTPRGRVVPHVAVQAMAATTLLILGFQLQSWEFHVLFQALVDQPGSLESASSSSVAVNVADESVSTEWSDIPRAREYVQDYFAPRRVDVLWDDLDSVVKKLRALWPGEAE